MSHFLPCSATILLHILAHLPQFHPLQWSSMARPEKRKWQRADDPPPDPVPSKKAKSRGAFRSPPNFPPEFYDNLSTIWLTSRAKRELDRRNDDHPPSKSASRLVGRHRSAKVAALGRFGVSELALFATDGGPDLGDLRGVCLYCQIFTCHGLTNLFSTQGRRAYHARWPPRRLRAASERNQLNRRLLPPKAGVLLRTMRISNNTLLTTISTLHSMTSPMTVNLQNRPTGQKSDRL